jgi:hypothetical protein
MPVTRLSKQLVIQGDISVIMGSGSVAVERIQALKVVSTHVDHRP